MAKQDSIAVLGAGAIGGVLAAALGDAGRSVTLCDRIGFDVLERTFEGETRRYRHPVITTPEGPEEGVDTLLRRGHVATFLWPALPRTTGGRAL